MRKLIPINLKKWIDENRQFLKPPVGNAHIWHDTEFMITIVGGPNSRKDYHIDPGEEFFYQLEGEIILKVVEDEIHRDIPIKEGEIFLLPPMVPHSPQRGPNTVGLVIERIRTATEIDSFVWYCEACNNLLHKVDAHVSNLTTQIKQVFDSYWSDLNARTCKSCGEIMSLPK